MLNTRITTPSTKKPFFSVIEPPTIPPSFAPVGRCVGRTRPGRHPLPTNNCLCPLSGQRGEKTRYLTPALAFLIKWQDDMRFAHNDWPHFRWRIPMFLEVNRGTKKSRRKNRRFCCADSLTTSRSAGSCGILKGCCSGYEIEEMTSFVRESSVSLVPQRTTGVFQNYLGTNGSSEIAALKAIKCRNIFAKFPFVFFLSLSKTTVSMCSLPHCG